MERSAGAAADEAGTEAGISVTTFRFGFAVRLALADRIFAAVFSRRPCHAGWARGCSPAERSERAGSVAPMVEQGSASLNPCLKLDGDRTIREGQVVDSEVSRR